ncbi:MAG TPA: hypothetical protein DEB06_05175 [Phycisphaerales bacterium]|nr:hypothetical protein [Phycisphaerales bacterium]
MIDPFELSPCTRRDTLLRGAGAVALVSGVGALLSGCASGSSKGAGLPGVNWPDAPIARKNDPAPHTHRNGWQSPQPASPDAGIPSGVIPRSDWARAQPVPSLMDRAQPYYRITIHHDGMTVFTSPNRNETAARLESIRLAHRGRNFGDIGYHYLIDPAGRVWEGRPLSWQGAHVKATNEGNLGICMLGNYMHQRPNPQQIAALDRFVAEQMRRYRVPVSRVFTHRELAQTECPGSNLQSYCVQTRRAGVLASA